MLYICIKVKNRELVERTVSFLISSALKCLLTCLQISAGQYGLALLRSSNEEAITTLKVVPGDTQISQDSSSYILFLAYGCVCRHS